MPLVIGGKVRTASGEANTQRCAGKDHRRSLSHKLNVAQRQTQGREEARAPCLACPVVRDEPGSVEQVAGHVVATVGLRLLAHDLGQPFNQALAATYLAMLQQLCADEATARASAEEALALTTEYKTPYYRAWSGILVGYALACEQPGTPTIASLRESIAAFKASGARLRLPYYLGLLAQVCGRAGRAEDGLAAIDEGMAASRAHNERWWDAELHRVRGELLLAGGADAHDAEAAYVRAIEVARTQQARALELRAATSLARLRSTQSGADDSRRLLQNLYSWFTEGFDTPDLQAARSLLAKL